MNTIFVSGYGFAPVFFLVATGFVGLIFGLDLQDEKPILIRAARPRADGDVGAPKGGLSGFRKQGSECFGGNAGVGLEGFVESTG